MNISLREVQTTDLPDLFQLQSDAESAAMAAIHPRDSEAFYAHWDRILANPDVFVRAIQFGDSLAGSISCFQMEEHHCVGYWIGKDFWNRSVATNALELLLNEVPHRPLQAHVASANVASIRVLEKNGFVAVGTEFSPGTDYFVECEVTIMESRQ